jgi:hypothetical protein
MNYGAHYSIASVPEKISLRSIPRPSVPIQARFHVRRKYRARNIACFRVSLGILKSSSCVTGVRVTLKEVLCQLGRITGKKILATYEPPRSGDTLHSQADISPARKIPGDEQRVLFEEGLKRTWDWHKSAYGRK